MELKTRVCEYVSMRENRHEGVTNIEKFEILDRKDACCKKMKAKRSSKKRIEGITKKCFDDLFLLSFFTFYVLVCPAYFCSKPGYKRGVFQKKK